MTQLVERRGAPAAAPKKRRRPTLPGSGPGDTSRTARALPAAYEWEDVSLPGVKVIRARVWLPLILLAFCAVALVYLVQTSGVATTGYDLQRLQVERSEWVLRNDQLRLELAKRRSLAWIESDATGRLGMVRPAETTFLRIPRERAS